jgi:hypothetical protein
MSTPTSLQPDLTELVKNVAEIYQKDSQNAAKIADVNKQRAAFDVAGRRFMESIRNSTASKAVIDSFGEFLKAVQGKEVEAIGALLEATKGRITALQTLQREQAELMMNTLTAPDKAVSGIASLGMTIATICRFFGADDFAKQIEDKSKELMDGVHARMKERLDQNAKEFASQHDENKMLADTAKEVQDRFLNSEAPQNAANMTINNAPNGLASPTALYAKPHSVTGVPAGNTPITMTEFKQNLAQLGLTETEINRFIPEAGKAARLGGDKTTIDSKGEARGIIDSPAMQSLPKDKATKVTGYLMERAPA